MNNIDLQAELSRNESDKQLIKAELEASRNKWADFILEHKDELFNNTQPIVVRKKTKVRWKEFIDKLKSIFGLKPRKEEDDGIEAYLQYRNEIDRSI